MAYLLPTFKAVSLIFAIAAVGTGVQALVDPVGFSTSFGLPLSKTASDNERSYVSLMGVRQLATGITLLTFAYQGKWREMATLLAILGIVVAGTDGIYLSQAGKGGLARFHAIPGALIAALAGAVLYVEI